MSRASESAIRKLTRSPYPLTLNALVAGCNQKSSRDPVLNASETDVQAGVDGLKSMLLVIERSGGRVARYAHNVERMMNVPQQAAALLAVLMLRGPQTAGELRINCERLHRFADISEVEALLNELADRPEGALVAELPRPARLAREPLDASSHGSATGAVIFRGRFIG
jgi:uncharacterized protein YceH (UPF0502 family)